MSLGVSSVLPVKRALLALIQASTDFAGAYVRMNLPATEPTIATRAYVLANLPRDYEDLTQQGGKTESYVVPVFLECRTYGDDVDANEEAAENLVAAVFGLIDSDRELGGACRHASADRVVGPISQPTVDGWITQVTVDVQVESWL